MRGRIIGAFVAGILCLNGCTTGGTDAAAVVAPASQSSAKMAARRDAENDKGAFVMRAEADLADLQARVGLLDRPVRAGDGAQGAALPESSALGGALATAKAAVAALKASGTAQWLEQKQAVEAALASAHAAYEATEQGLAH